jgi:hypothetical protein
MKEARYAGQFAFAVLLCTVGLGYAQTRLTGTWLAAATERVKPLDVTTLGRRRQI